MTVSVAIIVVAVLVVVLAIWQTIQIQAVRKKVDAVPADGNTVMMLQNLHHRASVNEASIQALDARLQSLERRMPDALTRFGVIAYDAFGNITGNQSRSIAMLADSGDGIVLSILAAREETLFYMKEVRSGRGVDELAPEEQQAVDRAMGR
jgi:signal transduction histidine kinase